eukprot:TRINITY_DN28610_c0_g1_i1.p1 TRINITY_DN28610_c0_g1~~TRINITY_DN28610_c0_g1_i1.p1  ORF type:complete len:904 (+),score=166.38 TRINITY_DN28610_c0_g1_i1:139-2850(+)
MVNSACFGKCLPSGVKGYQKQKSFGEEADAEIARLHDEIRQEHEIYEMLQQRLDEIISAPPDKDDPDIIDKMPSGRRVSVAPLEPEDDQVEQEQDDQLRTLSSGIFRSMSMSVFLQAGMSRTRLNASILGKSKLVQGAVLGTAFLFVVFVLMASSTKLGWFPEAANPGGELEVDGHADEADHGHHTAAHGGEKDHSGHANEADHGPFNMEVYYPGGEEGHDPGGHDDTLHTSAHGGEEDHGGHADALHASAHGGEEDHAGQSAEVDHGKGHRLASIEESSDHDSHGSHGSHDSHDSHAAHAGVSPLLQNVAFSLTSCGLIAFLVGLAQQPLILGYLLGGILVGPQIGLDVVHSHESVAEISNLGLVFLLFMIGLELDVKALLNMGRVVILVGLLQFPICAGIQVAFFSALHAAGLNLGTGQYAAMYCGIVCGISSTMIVVKLLGERGETEQPDGRLTIGILIFQDIWAMVFLAIQPNLASPNVVGLLKTFGMIALLIIIALSYAKFIMPAILFYASKSVELMLVLSIAWCFFMGITAILPWIGIGMELAALIAGVALATFPYSAEFNGKLKYIRDFFITLFFAALGMQIPVPSFQPIATACVIALLVLLFRWLGICLLVFVLGGGPRLGALATINLSQISEFALVICSLGMHFDHIGTDTLTIIIWTFMILAILSANIIGQKHKMYKGMARLVNKLRGRASNEADGEDHDHDHDHRSILLLGFHKIASMLVSEFERRDPALLKMFAVVDTNQDIKGGLEKRGLKFGYGDFSSADVLEHAFHGKPQIVLSTTPNSMLQGVTNLQILKVSKEVWPEAYVIVSAENPTQAQELYNAGADYVLRTAKLCAERLHVLLCKHQQDAASSELRQAIESFKMQDTNDFANPVKGKSGKNGKIGKRASFIMA